MLNQIESLKSEKFKIEVDIKELQSQQKSVETEKISLQREKQEFEKLKTNFSQEVAKQKEAQKVMSQKFQTRLKQEEQNFQNMERKYKNQISELKLAQETVQMEIPTLDSFALTNKGKYFTTEILDDYNLKLLLVQERENTEKANILVNCLKEELEHSLFENQRLKASLDKEREKAYNQTSGKAKASVSFAAEQNSPQQSHDNVVKYFSGDKPGEAPLNLTEEFWLGRAKKDPFEGLKEALLSADKEVDLSPTEDVDMDKYVESIISNKKLSRDIRETLQILLKRETKQIQKIKDETERDVSGQDMSKDMEDAEKEIKFLEERIQSLDELKDILQNQLQEEYKNNRDLRRENKELSDELLECKENLVEKISEGGKAQMLLSINTLLSKALQSLLPNVVGHIRARSDLLKTISDTTEGKFVI